MVKTEISWQCDVPVITNAVMMRQLVFIFALAPALVIGLLAVAFWAQGDLSPLLPLAVLIYGLALGLLLLGLLVSAAIYRNRMRMSFSVKNVGFEAVATDNRLRRVGWLTLLLGALASRPGAVGTGLLALSTTRWAGRWSAITQIRIHPSQYAIELRNDWRTVAVLYCTAENFEAVRALVAGVVKPRDNSRNPVGDAVMWTLMVVAACIPTFTVESPFTVNLLASMILICFSVATVWLVPGLAYAVLATCAWILGEMTMGGIFTRVGMHSKPSSPAYTTANGDAWASLAITIVGIAFLCWFSFRVLHGKYTPVLLADEIDLGDQN